ncbi:tail fiber protein [Bradyrhizobium brasilense]|uniref:phage tail protein n=1 Tax=Bradyrhizobium brasilense TaxID=1419277 RepID=UPI0024B2814A|nr:tail fiber protein [Bradyrhizobium australafricanum]WFU35672.1 tail fiber protein [Bradyrhizobium australafricanum]
MTLYKWSRIAASDATADSSINWQEGQAPSSVNDSARAMMAATAKYRDDIAGAIVTTGSSTSYALSSYQQFDSFANMNGAMVAFTPHITNGGITVINVDGLGNRPLRTAPGVELQAGVIIQGTPYAATYNNSDAVWYLHGFFGNPYNVPLAAGMDYWAPTAPNSSFVFPVGQAISRTTYATLFALVGTLYGAGDGSTTFNLPDKRGRASVAADAGAGRISGATFSSLSPNGTGGSETQTLVTANLPPYTPTGSVSGSITGNAFANFFSTTTGTQANVYSPTTGTASPLQVSGTFSGTLAANPQGGTSTPFSNVQPSIVCNYIMRII